MPASTNATSVRHRVRRAPRISSGEAGSALTRLNDHAQTRAGKMLLSLIRAAVRDIHERYLISLPDREFKVLSAVLSRTLGWNKYAERITKEQLSHGLLRTDGFVSGSDGFPAFAGTRVSTRDLKARGDRPSPTDWLHDRGLITGWEKPHGRVFMYGTPGLFKILAVRELEAYTHRRVPALGEQKWSDAVYELVEILDILIAWDEDQRRRPLPEPGYDLEQILLGGVRVVDW